MEADWNLVRDVGLTTRTRGGGNGRPDFEMVARRKDPSLDVVFSAADKDEATESSEGQDDESAASAPTATPTAKPTHTRVILEVSQLEQVFQKFPCPDCGDNLELNLRTVCIATYIRLDCNNKRCSFVSDYDKPCTTTMHVDDRGDYERMTD